MSQTLTRPKKIIDWKVFEDLCQIQCTQGEICSVLHITEDNLKARVEEQYGESYMDAYKRFSDGGKSSLRRTQFKLAQKNAAMAIWLGKQSLGQKDHQEEEILKFKALENQTLVDKLVSAVDGLHRSAKIECINISSEQKSACDTGA